jgi:5-methylcytosine-specific restriction endonuclease McrA
MVKALLKQFDFKTKIVTIQNLWEWTIANDINFVPIVQRNNVEDPISTGTTPSKFQGILESIFEGLDIGEVSFSGEDSVDGGHRCRSIIAFLRNELPLHKSSPWGAAFLDELPKEARDYFRGYKVRSLEFLNLTGPMVGMQVEQTNTVSPMFFQEKMNSHGLLRTVVRLREMTSVVDYGNRSINASYTGVTNKRHELYKNHNDLLFDDKRHIYFLHALESIVMHHRGTFGAVTEQDIRDYVMSGNTSNEDCEKAERSLAKEHTFIHNIAIFWKEFKKGRPLTIQDYHFLRIVYWTLRTEYGSNQFDVNDYRSFSLTLINSYHKFANRTAIYDKDSKLTTIGTAFKSYVKKINMQTKLNVAKGWVMTISKTAVLENVTFRDKVRSFPAEMLSRRYEEMKGCDEVTGDPIPYDMVVGAHITPHSQGGKTEYSNLMITSAYHNSKMGVRDALEYAEEFRLSRLEDEKIRAGTITNGVFVEAARYDSVKDLMSSVFNKKETA